VEVVWPRTPADAVIVRVDTPSVLETIMHGIFVLIELIQVQRPSLFSKTKTVANLVDRQFMIIWMNAENSIDNEL
jgi:hypothetical protein